MCDGNVELVCLARGFFTTVLTESRSRSMRKRSVGGTGGEWVENGIHRIIGLAAASAALLTSLAHTHTHTHTGAHKTRHTHTHTHPPTHPHVIASASPPSLCDVISLKGYVLDCATRGNRLPICSPPAPPPRLVVLSVVSPLPFSLFEAVLTRLRFLATRHKHTDA